MTKIIICNEPECHNAATTEGYCRLHYLRHWKKIKDEAKKRAAKQLNRYIEEVMQKHPDRYLEVIKKDIRSPSFERFVGETFGYDDDDAALFNDPAYEEEVEKMIKQLKIEKGF